MIRFGMRFNLLAVFAVFLGFSCPCFSQLTQWDATGSIAWFIPDKVVPAWLPDAAFGQEFSLSFTLGHGKKTIYPGPGESLSVYPASNAVATIGSHSWRLTDCAMRVLALPGQYPFFFHGSDASGTLHFTMGLNSTMYTGDGSLPSDLPPLTNFVVRYLAMHDEGSPPTGIFAEISNVALTPGTIPVPEPSTYAIASLFLLVAATALRSRKETHRM